MARRLALKPTVPVSQTPCASGCDSGTGHSTPKSARPAREEIDRAALRLIARRGAEILATARRYAATPEDGEDPYQRDLEILLRKAPTTREEELVPWLKTVVIRTIDVTAARWVGCRARSNGGRVSWGTTGRCRCLDSQRRFGGWPGR